jgi:hypothetical protein
MHYRAHLLGGPREIDPADIAHFRDHFKKTGGSTHLHSTWRYYATLSGE